MGLFDRKYCDVCGEKIGLLGNRKLEDGNLCRHCAAKLSPYFTGRRHTSLEDIKAQLAYREENRESVTAFRATRTLGTGTRLLIDDGARRFLVAKTKDLATENPDVLSLDDVTGVEIGVKSSRTELKQDGPDGKKVSFDPPRYDYDFRFDVTIHVNNPYFDEITYPLNGRNVRVRGVVQGRLQLSAEMIGRGDPAYREYEALAEKVRHALDPSLKKEEKAEEKRPVVCPYCGATTTPDAKGCCEYCGAPLS